MKVTTLLTNMQYWHNMKQMHEAFINVASCQTAGYNKQASLKNKQTIKQNLNYWTELIHNYGPWPQPIFLIWVSDGFFSMTSKQFHF